ncbi:Wzz/FepE/Etk N-terminal domain-containing protein [Mucilaginibacter sp. MD40]|uniref:Wzz/FepE/Etk N-terminal domain-containing protein n=1 Tax=Mucilaginibacter sp. MD40 TaxID=2029590 RepID=UPI001E3C6D1E|nr:Wzz/FepE/Etk N-terminal domain-containing protein [Mucilaginibacter sp. MD40]
MPDTINTKETTDTKNEITLKELIFKVKDWWEYLCSKWIRILIFSVIGAVLGFTYALFQKPLYTATTTFVLEAGESGGRLSQYAGLASMVGVDLGGQDGGIFQGDNIIELYKSRKMLEKTLLTSVVINNKRQTLMQYYIEFNKLKKTGQKSHNYLL